MNKRTIFCIILSLVLISTTGSYNFGIVHGTTQMLSPNIISLSEESSYPGEEISIYGTNFGMNPGMVLLTGLAVEPTSWSETFITFIVPEDATTGVIYIRDAEKLISNKVDFTVLRTLDEGQIEPYNLEITDTGLLGAAFLVESDGEYIYGISGFETLSTFEIRNNQEYKLCSRIYLPQRVGDLQLYNGYLFCSGDHGLVIYRCSDLQQGNTEVVAGISGRHYLGIDVKEKRGNPIDGILVALCDYLPSTDTQELGLELYQFIDESLVKLGEFERPALSTERQYTIAIDPLYPKVYVSGGETLFGEDKYILEILIEDPSKPILNHREETDGLLAFDMETANNILWTGVVYSGTELFRTYTTNSGTNHLILDQTITGPYGLGRTTRVKIIDETTTVGSAWSGARPDIFLLDTHPSSSSTLASTNSLDWAFDVAGYREENEEYDGKIIVADEWGGFLTYEYSIDTPCITHQENYHWAPATAMTENIHLSANRIYIANRGAGIWSANRNDLSDETEWRHPPWEWGQENPQPYPISALALREDPTYGTLIAALGHEKAMAWGNKIYGFLYKENSDTIERLAISEEIEPPGIYSTGSSVVWPESDLVFMTTGTDGIRAYIIDPDEPSIRLHKDCRNHGFATDIFSTNNIATCMKYYSDGVNHKLIIGSTPGLLVDSPTLNVFNITYPEGIPDRNNPDRPIEITHDLSLDCTQYKTVNYIDITDAGIVAMATTQGIGLFDISWITELNSMSVTTAWNKIRIPTESYTPFWNSSWSPLMKDVAFVDENTLYCVKTPQGKNLGGVWRINFEIKQETMSHTSFANGYYPGVECGMDYSQFLQGWANPDIPTIHHPYALAADEKGVFVTGWSGKVQEITYTATNEPPTIPSITGPVSGKTGESYTYTASSKDPEGSELEYLFDWGDGSNTSWQSSTTASHSWTNQGNFDIKVKAKDTQGAESGWGRLTVTMPRSKAIRNIFLEKLFDFFINEMRTVSV